ncbi:hypothetical protein [Deinococcus sp. LM3]|uniref:hypothetical protein n=1 Tax=Deinococcus sp. LM3 TaxID=1938608 RepID=UPI00117DD028|nr:hypothetical protein [Deinococcus sp. LM3]
MARWNFNLAPRIGLLPIRLGMSLSDAGSILGLNPSSVISEGSGMKRAVYGDIVILYADYTDTIFSISCTLYGDKEVSMNGHKIIFEEYWSPDINETIASLGKYEIMEGVRHFHDLGVAFPDRIDNDDTSDQIVSVYRPHKGSS